MFPLCLARRTVRVQLGPPRSGGGAMDAARLVRMKARADVELAQISAAKRRLQRATWLAQRRAQRFVDTVSEVAFILFV